MPVLIGIGAVFTIIALIFLGSMAKNLRQTAASLFFNPPAMPLHPKTNHFDPSAAPTFC